MARKKRRQQQLHPVTAPVPPGQGRMSGFLTILPQRQAGVVISEETALTYAAVWACVKVISEDIAGLPWHVLQRLPGGGKEHAFSHPVDWLLDIQASPEVPAFQFREAMIAHALTWGNGYAEIERDMLGRPVWMHLLTPDRVTPMRDGANGEIIYEIQNYTRGPSYVPARNMFHLRGLGFDGLVGYSVISMAARSIGMGIAQEQNATSFFANDSTPGGLLKHPGQLSDRVRNNLARSWEARHQGPDRQRRIAVLEEGMDWVQTGLPPENSQFLQSRQFQPEEICRWFRLTPHKIQHLLHATFSNIEHLSLDYVNDTLTPWCKRLEGEGNLKLFGRIQMGTYITKLNLTNRLRGDSAARSAYVTKMLSWGVMNLDEARESEDLNPLPGGQGQEHFVPANTVPLERALDPPEPEPAAPSITAGPQPSANGTGREARPEPDQLRAALRPVFLDALRRVAHRAMHRVQDAKRRDPEGWREKLQPFWVEHLAYAGEQLAAPWKALRVLSGDDPNGTLSLEGLKALSEQDSPDWNGWAESETDRLLSQALFDESEIERDDRGRFAGGGGGGGSSGDDDDQEEARQEEEDTRREQDREREDLDREVTREQEDEKREAAREREDARIEKTREKEDAALEKKEERLELDREKMEARHERENEKVEAAQEKEDERRERAREKEDAALEKMRDDKEEELAEKVDRGEMTEEESDAEWERFQSAEGEYGKAVAEQGERHVKEDAEIAAARFAEQQEREARQEAEEAELERRRETLDEEVAAVEARREQEDADRTVRREQEDAEIQARREQEDAEIDARREVEDLELAKARKGGVE